MFDKSFETRLKLWREFREQLETSLDPFQHALDFYNKAPTVSMHTDPYNRDMWPGPWELLYENQYCNFCKLLGVCYSLQLTDRFSGSNFEIHIGIDRGRSETHYMLLCDSKVLGYPEECTYCDKNSLPKTLKPSDVFGMPPLS